MASDQSDSGGLSWLLLVPFNKLKASDWDPTELCASPYKGPGAVRACACVCVWGLLTLNTPSAKCIYHVSVCGCHGSSCGGSAELGQADASLVAIILISYTTTLLSNYSTTHLKAMINRLSDAKKMFFKKKYILVVLVAVCFKNIQTYRRWSLFLMVSFAVICHFMYRSLHSLYLQNVRLWNT